MIKKELRKISLEFRTLSSQMLKIDSQEEIGFIKAFYDFITETPFIYDYIVSCHTVEYDFELFFKEKRWNERLELPSRQSDLIDYEYQLLRFILEGKRQLFFYGQGYTSSNKFADMISSFMRKAIEPFVVALRSYLEMSLIDASDTVEEISAKEKTLFLSYCQKDSDIADIIDSQLTDKLADQVHISRDIRDVAYHESFGKFMNSIEDHDYVISIISNRYLHSRNCMYEVLEVVKDSKFHDKLVFIVLCDNDKQYLRDVCDEEIGANVYSPTGQTQYSMFWATEEKRLQQQIEDLGDPTYAIAQIKEKRIVQKILLDLPEFLEFVKDNKGLSLSEHIAENFESITKFMGF